MNLTILLLFNIRLCFNTVPHCILICKCTQPEFATRYEMISRFKMDELKIVIIVSCLCLMCLCEVKAQCTSTNLEISKVSSTQLSISWLCYDSGAEFHAMYRLINRGQCDDTGHISDDPPFHTQVREWGTWNRQDDDDLETVDTYQHSATLSNLLPYSTYIVYVRTRRSNGAGGYNLSDNFYLSSTTSEAAPNAGPAVTVAESTASSLSFSWTEIPCGSRGGLIIRYNYKLIKQDDNTIVRDQDTADALQMSVTISSGIHIGQMYEFQIAGINGNGTGPKTTITASTIAGTVPGVPVNLTALNTDETSVRLQWKSPKNSSGIIPNYTIRYKAIQKTHDSRFVPSDETYASVPVPPNSEGPIHGYTVNNLNPSTKYEFQVSGRTSAGSGEYAIIEVFTKAFTGLKQPNIPFIKIEDAIVQLVFNDLPEFVSNVYVAAESSNTRNKRQGGNNIIEDFIVANLTRKQVEDTNIFIVGDNKTYGGYVNHDLIGGNLYGIRVAFASCTHEECSVAWSTINIIIAPVSSNIVTSVTTYEPPTSTTVSYEPIILVTAVVIVLICFCIAVMCFCRSRKTPVQEVPKEENEIYDEIDREAEMMAIQQRSQPVETEYEVNIAMETKTSVRPQSDGSGYEDVSIKEETTYQGLDLDAVVVEQSYQGLKGY